MDTEYDNLAAALVYNYLSQKDKNLGEVFHQKFKVVSMYN